MCWSQTHCRFTKATARVFSCVEYVCEADGNSVSELALHPQDASLASARTRKPRSEAQALWSRHVPPTPTVLVVGGEGVRTVSKSHRPLPPQFPAVPTKRQVITSALEHSNHSTPWNSCSHESIREILHNKAGKNSYKAT